jgi:hypothetical protein
MLLVIVQPGGMSLRHQRRRRRVGAYHCHHTAAPARDVVNVDMAKAEQDLEDHCRKRNAGGGTSGEVPRHH